MRYLVRVNATARPGDPAIADPAAMREAVRGQLGDLHYDAIVTERFWCVSFVVEAPGGAGVARHTAWVLGRIEEIGLPSWADVYYHALRIE